MYIIETKNIPSNKEITIASSKMICHNDNIVLIKVNSV